MYFSYPGLLERLAVEQKQEERDKLLICDIQTGIFYVDEHLGNIMKDVKQMVSQREISFDVVWALFFPNSLVYSHHTNTDQDTVLIVRRSGYTIRHREVTKDDTSLFEKTEYLEVVCDIIHHDGQEFGFARRIFEIDKYPGTRPIANLPVYPLQYHDNNYGVYSRAVELGKHLVQLPIHCFREIRGRASRRVDRYETEPTSVRLFFATPSYSCPNESQRWAPLIGLIAVKLNRFLFVFSLQSPPTPVLTKAEGERPCYDQSIGIRTVSFNNISNGSSGLEA